MRIQQFGRALVVALVVALVGALAAGTLTGAASSASAVAAERTGPDVPATAGEMLDWLAGNPSRVGLVAYRPDRPDAGIAHRPGERFPLASVRKVLILGAYAERVAAGRLDPDERIRLRAVERWYWPGTDGGAHPAAVQAWREDGKIEGEGPRETVALDDVAQAMITYSDNAAADYLLIRVGRGAVTAFAHRHRLRDQDPVWPLYGEYVAWATVPADAWVRMRPDQRAAVAWRLSRSVPRDVAIRLPLPDLPTQARLAAASAAGTPAEWAELMRRLHAGEGMSTEAHEVTRRVLEWILDEPGGAAFRRFGFKDGSFVGVLAMASYIQPTGGPPTVSAVFLRRLPVDLIVDPEAYQTFVAAFFAFNVRLATDPGFFAEARDRLGESAGSAAGQAA